MSIGLFILIVLVISGLVGALAFLFRGEESKTDERLGQLVSGRRHKTDPGADILRQGAYENDKKSLLETITPNLPSLRRMYEQADAHIQPSALFGIGLVLAGLGVSASVVASASTKGSVPFLTAPIAGVLLFAVPFAWLWNKRRVRLNTFAGQLPDALELIARALRAGHSLAAGMQVVADEMPSPICDEFGRVYQEQNMGISLEDALRSMCERVPNLDLRFFVTSVAIQRQTGGDLAEILDKIGHVIRERYKILGQVKALTGEGRLSGVVLVALPFALLLVMLYIQPEYIRPLWTDPRGKKMAGFAIFLQILGAYVIKKIVDIKV
jgi:tight adherence protein B